MPNYLYLAVQRRADGTVGPTLHAQVIEAATADEAIARARRIDLDMDGLGANAVYLAAPDDGRAIWSLHTVDRSPGTTVDGK